ncbi:MAG: TMEM165/GDT1 family protein [Kiritimatiellae bacterium]|nr:TMEM165/GDT1 family protein [Kiritimatiellia bacterium]
MLTAFGISMFAVVLAEMGDKTQLLAMAFATRYRWQTVLWAVAVATLFNHFLAVVTGNVITNIVPIEWVKLLAAVSFLLFGLWTLHDDATPGSMQRAAISPFMTVAIAFFIAEMGDKTQLMTMTLAAEQVAKVGGTGLAAKIQQIVPVWMGTTCGMIVADAIGILVGIVLNKRIPTHIVKWVAAIMFAVFGLLGIHASLDLLLPKGVTIHHGYLLGFIPVMAMLMIMIAKRSARRAEATALVTGRPA